MRDDFLAKVKNDLAWRAAHRCSNPNCRRPTISAKGGEEGTVNVGEAAHICAASKGGARYDIDMNSQERSSSGNGIWLCRNCAAMIDRDPEKYTVAVLRKWKRCAEEQSFGVNESDRSVIDEITKACESNQMRYMLEKHDFHNFYEASYVLLLMKLSDKLSAPSTKVQHEQLSQLIEDLVEKISDFATYLALNSFSTSNGSDCSTVEGEDSQKKCNEDSRDIWNKYTEIMSYSKNLR